LGMALKTPEGRVSPLLIKQSCDSNSGEFNFQFGYKYLEGCRESSKMAACTLCCSGVGTGFVVVGRFSLRVGY
jgi:hypothetical protein